MEVVDDEGIVQKALKRDKFACSSCGLTPRATVLKVVWSGGTDSSKKRSLRNAITLCPECCIEPKSFRLPPSFFAHNPRIDDLATQKWQLERYERQERRKVLAEKKNIVSLLQELDAHHLWTDNQLESTKKFISELGIEEVRRAVGIASATGPKGTVDGRFRYFCGICHNWIRGT